jgi:ElaB/YqjD/DUF883 family membrane-anchored ribosome-binding protein
MELINEINIIKNLMNLNVLNEAAPLAWVDEVWMAVKSIFTNYRLGKSSIENFIIKGFKETEFKNLKKSILESKNGQLGVDLKTALTTAKNNLPPTATADKLLIETRIKQIDNLIKSIPTRKFIKTTIKDLETSYPTLFKKKWYGSYANQGRIDVIEKQVLRDIDGKSAKDIESILEKKLSDADTKLYNKKGAKKSEFQKLIKRYREYMIAHPWKSAGKTLGGVVAFSILVYLLYSFIVNSNETSSPISGTVKTVSDIWGDVKKGWHAAKPYPSGPDGLLLYLNAKYGNKNWKQDCKLDINGNIYIVTYKSSGESKTFKHNGTTFNEL